MYVVRKLTTGTVHVVPHKESYKTLGGKLCQSNVINDCNHGFGSIKHMDDILNKPKISCLVCRRMIANTRDQGGE